MGEMHRRTWDDFHRPKTGEGYHVAPSKSVVTKVLDAVTAGGNTLLSLLSGLLAAAMILYSGFVLYDTFYTQNAAYSSGLDLLQYKPEIIEEGKTPKSGAETLAAVNAEYQAWLTLYDTNIDYPVMQHDNDLYYASHDVYGKTSLTGAIYMAARNSSDLSDSYNLIYGHHMDNGAMFGALDAYTGDAYRDAHREGVLVGRSGVFDLNVFAVVDTDAYESAIYTVGDRMDEVIDFLKAPSDTTTVRYFDEDALEGAEKIVALSTCAAANTNGRLVVFATMTRRPMITVSAEGFTGVYDDQPHGIGSVTPSITTGTTVYYKTGEDGEWTTTKPTRTDAGTTRVWIKVSNDYYGEATTEADITVTPYPVTVTANNGSKIYGTEDPELSAAVSAHPGSGPIDFTVTRPGAGTDENADLYTGSVVPSGETEQGNYTVTYLPGDFTIAPAPVTVYADSTGKTYGENDPAFTGTVVGLRNDGTSIDFTVTRPGAGTDENAGDYPDTLIASGAARQGNYTVTYVSGSFTINRAPIVVTADSKSKVYGNDDPAFTATVSNKPNDGFEIVYTVTRPGAGTDENVGGYPDAIIPTGDAIQGNYRVTYVPAVFTIDPAVMRIDAEGYDGFYDAQTHFASAMPSVNDGNTTVEYLVNGTWTTEPPSVTDVLRNEKGETVGTTYRVRAKNPNYLDAETSVLLRVRPFPVTVQANDAAKTYGEEDDPSAFTATVTPNRPDNTPFVVTVTRSNPDVNDAGTYNDVLIPALAEDPGQRNYAITYIPGDFEIRRVGDLPLVIHNYNEIYDGDDHEAYAACDVPGTTIEYFVDGAWTTERPTIRNVNETRTVPVRATNPNYETAESVVTLTVRPYPVVVRAENDDKTYGEGDPGFTYSVTTNRPDDTPFVVTVARNNPGQNDAGIYNDVLIPTLADDPGHANYDILYETGDFEIRPFPVVIRAENNSKTYSEEDPEFTYYITPDRPDDTPFVVTVTRNNPEQNNAGTYNDVLVPTLTDDPGHRNYVITYDPGDFEIRRYPVTIRAVANGKTYGADDPAFEVRIGAKPDDGFTLTYDAPSRPNAENERNVGTYPGSIVVTGPAEQGNYIVTYEPAEFTIRPYPVTIQAVANEKTYGEDDPAFEVRIGAKPDDGFTLTYDAPSRPNAANDRDAGTYPGAIVVTGPAEQGNYIVTYERADFEIRPFPVTIQAEDTGKNYGEDDPAVFPWTITADRPDDTPFDVTVVRQNPEVNDAGTYDDVLIPTLTEDPGHRNYVITYVPGDFEIRRGVMRILPENYDGVYDFQYHNATATATITEGTTIEYFYDGAWTETPPRIRDVEWDGNEPGIVRIPVRATNPGYETATGEVTLRVTPAVITVTAKNSVKTFGEDDPAFEAEVSGSFDGTVVDYRVDRSNPDQNGGGEYPGVLIPTGPDYVGGPNGRNFVVRYVPGNFRIVPDGTLAVAATGHDDQYDTNTYELSYTVNYPEGTTIEFFIDGEPVDTVPSIRDVTEFYVTVRASHPDYGTDEDTVLMRVRPRPVTVKVPSSSKLEGEKDPDFNAPEFRERVQIKDVIDDFVIEYTISRPGAGTDEFERVDTYENALVATGDTLQGNYIVTYEPGRFVIIRNPGGAVTNTTDEGGNDDEGGNEEILEEINDFRTPLANFINSFNPTIGPATPAWALVNLISLILTVYLLFPLLHMGDKFGRVKLMRNVNTAKEQLREAEELFDEQQLEKLRIERQAVIDKARAAGLDEEAAIREAEALGFVEVTEDEFSTAVEYLYYKVKKFLRRFRTGVGLEFIDTAVSLIVFMLTEDMRLPMILIDKWTPLMILFLAFCWVTDVRLARYREKVLADEEEELREQEAAVSAATTS